MIDESVNISLRSWTRIVENIGKVGYSDGVTDGQNTSFQSSFDMGYCQGLKFGLALSYKLAADHPTYIHSDIESETDHRRINCQICLDRTLISQNVVTLHKLQKEKNYEYLSKR